MSKNIETVQSIYAAFGRGDVPFILTKLNEDVDWEYGGTSEVPWLTPRRGRENVVGFFQDLTTNVDLDTFVPKRILDGGDVVVSLCDVGATVHASGKRIAEEDEIHIWWFNDAGEVTRFRHRADTAMQLAALKR